MKRNLFFVIKILIAAVLVFWLVKHVDWQAVGRELIHISWPLLILYVFLQIAGMLLSVRKWQVIARFKNLHFSLKEGFFTYLTGTFINNFLPSTLGGDAYRSLWLAEKTGSKAASLSSVLFDRFIGLWTTAGTAVVCSLFLWRAFIEKPALLVTLGILAFFVVAKVLITYLYSKNRFPHLLARIPFQKVRRLFEEIVGFARRKLWLEASLWSLGFIFVGLALSNYILFLALGYSLPFFSFLAVIFLVAIVTSIPISIGNLGVKEWAHIVFFSLIGVSVEAAVTVALLSRMVQMMLSFGALPHYFASKINGVKKEPELLGSSTVL